jgi:hypothetical protein
LALALGVFCTVGTPLLADLWGIDVAPGEIIPVGTAAGYSAILDSNPPPVSSYKWYWKGDGCGTDWTAVPDATTKDWAVTEKRTGLFIIKCEGLHPPQGIPPKAPPPTVKTINVFVAPPVLDEIELGTNINTPLPKIGYSFPTVKFLTLTGGGPAGAFVDGVFDRRVVDWNDFETFPGVTREANLTVVQFPFMDPDNVFGVVLNGQPFYEVTTTNRIACRDQCGVLQPKVDMNTRTIRWIRVDATHWKVIIIE